MYDKNEDGWNAQSRRKILSQVPKASLLSGLALSGSASATGGSENDGPSAGTDMNMPAGGGGGTSYSDYENTREACESVYDDLSFDFSKIDNCTSDGVEFTETQHFDGTDLTVTGAGGAVGYKNCDGYYREVLYNSLKLTIEDSYGVASYDFWIGVDTSGCIWMGDNHGCVKVDTPGRCKIMDYAEATGQHSAELFDIGTSLVNIAVERADDISPGDVLKAIITLIVTLTVIAIAVAASQAGAGS